MDMELRFDTELGALRLARGGRATALRSGAMSAGWEAAHLQQRSWQLCSSVEFRDYLARQMQALMCTVAMGSIVSNDQGPEQSKY